MTLILKQLFGLIKLLNSDKGTNQIAAGVAVGFILGMIPALSLQSLIIFALMFFFRIQLGMAFLSSFFFALIAFPLDGLFHSVGSWALELNGLNSFYTTLYNMPILPYTRFNNSIVMGASIIGLLLSPLIFVLAKLFVVKYREKVVAKLENTKIWKAVKATSFYKWYYKYDSLYG